MPDSLSVVLPVHNVNQALSRRVGELLDVLAELTAHFEILIVDDGSTDQTDEVAIRLARQFPQVHAICSGVQTGKPAAIQRGMQQARGEIVFVQPEVNRMHASDIGRLWALRDNEQFSVAGAAPRSLSPDLVKRLGDWGRGLVKSDESAGVRMLRRIPRERSAGGWNGNAPLVATTSGF